MALPIQGFYYIIILAFILYDRLIVKGYNQFRAKTCKNKSRAAHNYEADNSTIFLEDWSFLHNKITVRHSAISKGGSYDSKTSKATSEQQFYPYPKSLGSPGVPLPGEGFIDAQG